MYEYVDAAVVRAAAWPSGDHIEWWPDLTGQTGSASWRPWLQTVLQIPGFTQALDHASPTLVQRVREICAGHPVPERSARSAVVSVVRYLLRASGRATPFGLFAGVAPARIGPLCAARLGAGHHAVAGAEARWLTAVIERLEGVPALRPRLKVVANNLAFERDGHLVLEHRPGGGSNPIPTRVRLRATAPVRTAMALAGSPIRIRDLAAKLMADFPDVPANIVDQLLADLITQRFLLTSLRPPMTVIAPLDYLVAQLRDAQADDIPEIAETAGALHDIARGLAKHNSARSGSAAPARRRHLTAKMGALQSITGPTLAVDLRMDWDLTIPEDVAAEAAKAASIQVQLAGRRSLNPGWDIWHDRFLERYGPYAIVPLLDAIDPDTGLGYPAGYLGTAPNPAAGPPTARDALLLTLVQKATLRRQREIILDEALIAQLAHRPAVPAQTTTELTVRIDASSQESLNRGDFTLSILSISRMAGTMSGRFLNLFGDDDRVRMATLYAGRPPTSQNALIAQISAPTRYTGTENVARSPQAAPLVLSLGEYPDDHAAQLPVHDIAVTADPHQIYLVSLSQRRAVEPVVLNAVEPVNHTHPLVRFLAEAPTALAIPCTAFDWGAAASLPFLPALRYGRTIVSPARWLLTTADLPGRADAWEDWDQALSAWRDEVGLPPFVHLGDGDQRVTLDLAVPAHRVLLRDHLERANRASLRAAPAAEAFGWIDGYTHEIVIPLASGLPPTPAPGWLAGEITSREHGHLPGCDGRFSLKLYGHPDRQNDILIRHLPNLPAQLRDSARWWFLRYHDPDHHLRLRLTAAPGDSAATAHAVAAWSEHLRQARLISRVQWDTYYPETARFGGSAAMAAAEAYFAADSAAAHAELVAAGDPAGPDLRALAAASLVNLVVDMTGDSRSAMAWLIEHTRTEPSPPTRALYDQTLALADPDDHSTLATTPWGPDIAASWARRREMAAVYRIALATAAPAHPAHLLPDLLHLHHVRVLGTDQKSEALCLHLARAAAMSWTARRRRPS
jgi:thiopeptide-type bacteriocin biosynthesis protein